MRIVTLGIFRFNEDLPEPILLSQANELSHFSFFQRGSIKEMITFFNKTIVKRTPPGQRQTVRHEDYYVHIYMRSDGLAGTVTCDTEYPARVAFSLVVKLLDDFERAFPDWRHEMRNEGLPFPPLDEAIARYQDPAQADQIMRIQKNLDETREVLHKTIDSVLERGERLEDLVERSGELSAQSKLFYKQARRANSCCVVS